MVFSSCLIFSVSPGQKERKVENVFQSATTVFMFPDLDHVAVIKETHSSLRFICVTHMIRQPELLFHVMTI